MAFNSSVVKLVLLGNGSVGKSSIIAQFTGHNFERVYKQTIGVDFLEKKVQLRGEHTSLQVWDIGGQSLNSKMLASYLSGASVVFLCYDVTDPSSFSDLEDWLRTAKRHLDSKGKCGMYLLGNKIDLLDQRRVTKEQHDGFIAENDLSGGWFCSARSGEEVSRAFYRTAALSKGATLSSHELAYLDRPIAVSVTVPRSLSPGHSSTLRIGSRSDNSDMHPAADEQDGGRTAMADAIEAEDAALEAAKGAKQRRKRKGRPGTSCSVA